jgi:hypothetical protein
MGIVFLSIIVLFASVQSSEALSGDYIGFKSLGDDRSTLELVWGCLLTNFACVWTALHLNIPAKNEGRWVQLRRKLKWMFVTIFFPEYLVIISLSDWWLARLDTRIMHKNGYTNWTITHAFFANMGGLVLEYDRGTEGIAIHGRALFMLLEGNYLKLPSLSKEEIEDRSKADYFVKAAVAFQVGWTVVQIGARVVQHLPVSELELITVAFVVCSVVMYCFWWHKPVDVWTTHRIIYDSDLSKEIVKEINSYFPRGSLEHGRISNDMSLRMACKFPEIYGAITRKSEWFNATLLFLSAGLLGTMVCGLHCAAWNFSFPSPVEQKLWRVCSVVATVSIPLQALIILTLLVYVSFFDEMGGRFKYILECCMCPFVHLPIIAHMIARTTLIALVFICLRSVPVEVYQNVRWSAFIPYFN